MKQSDERRESPQAGSNNREENRERRHNNTEEDKKRMTRNGRGNLWKVSKATSSLEKK